MALQIHQIFRPISPAPELSRFSKPVKHSIVTGEARQSFNVTIKSKKLRSLVKVRSNLETEVVVGVVTEVDKDTFWPIANAAGDKTVILDMYTQWYANY